MSPGLEFTLRRGASLLSANAAVGPTIRSPPSSSETTGRGRQPRPRAGTDCAARYDEPPRRSHRSAHRRRSLTLPSPVDSLRRLSSLALVLPWCSLSGPVGSLPAGLRPLVVVVSFVVAVSVRCARVTHPSRPLVAAPRYAPRAPSGRSPRCATIASTGCGSRYAPIASAVCCAQRRSCMLCPVNSSCSVDPLVHSFRTACVGAGRGGASARTPYFATGCVRLLALHDSLRFASTALRASQRFASRGRRGVGASPPTSRSVDSAGLVV